MGLLGLTDMHVAESVAGYSMARIFSQWGGGYNPNHKTSIKTLLYEITYQNDKRNVTAVISKTLQDRREKLYTKHKRNTTVFITETLH